MTYRSPLVDTSVPAYLAYLYSCAIDNGRGEAFLSTWGHGVDHGLLRISGGGVGRNERGDFIRAIGSVDAAGVSCCRCGSDVCVSGRRCDTISQDGVTVNNRGTSEGESACVGDKSEHGDGINEGLPGNVRGELNGFKDKAVDLGDGKVLGNNTLRNRVWRQEKRARKIRKQQRQIVTNDVPEWRRQAKSVGAGLEEGGVDSAVGGDNKFGYFSKLSEEKRETLRESRAARLEAENRLHQAKAERALELLKATDVEKVKKMNETKIMRNTELNKVKVEQAFSRLSATGNVPGFAETVVSGAPTLSSGSISPNSSVSAAEVRAMQQELLELQSQSKEYSRLKESVKSYLPESVYDSLVKRVAETVETSFTADTMGHELASGGGFHYCDDGRYRPGERFDW